VMKMGARDYEIFIVNDASVDATRRIVKGIQQAGHNVTLIDCVVGPTRRENLAQSFKEANGDIIVFVDIDVIASLRFLPALIDQIVSGYDIAIGSRYLPGAEIRRKPYRLMLSRICNIVIRFFFRTKISDHVCGFKAFKRDVIVKLVEEMGYDSTLRRGVFWDTELLVRARHHGYTIQEIPIRWVERRKSAISFKRDITCLGYAVGFYMKFTAGL